MVALAEVENTLPSSIPNRAMENTILKNNVCEIIELLSLSRRNGNDILHYPSIGSVAYTLQLKANLVCHPEE